MTELSAVKFKFKIWPDIIRYGVRLLNKQLGGGSS
jgi:hypothetical protein